MSYFLTLTYEKEPEELDYKDVQLFLKRIRKTGMVMRYLFCSDFGERRGRKHWHGLIFVRDYSQVVFGNFADYWHNGFCDVRPCNDARVGYATGYAIKKVLTDNPVICHYSQGLGLAWLWRNERKTKDNCCIWFGSLRYAIPRYFRKKIVEKDPDWLNYYHYRLSSDLAFEADDVDFGVYVDSMRAEEQAKKIEYALKKGKGVL